jgi:signal transduction histidine kinase
MPHTNLGDFIAAHKPEIIGRWVEHIVEELALKTDDVPQLLNDLPVFLDDLVALLRESGTPEDCHESARSHGRQRKHIGVNIGALAIEFSLIAETILEVAHERAFDVEFHETRLLHRAIAKGTEQSVTEYAIMRDREIAEHAAQHYSFIAHELRTPLQTAVFALDLLIQELGTPRPLVDRLAQAIDSVTKAVDNSLVAVRLRGHPIPRYETLEAKTIVQETIAACRMTAERKGIRVNAHYDNLTFEADRKLLVSLLTNLLGNAIKFTPAKSDITICAKLADDHVRFEVNDRCGGMPEDLPGKLFQPHVQGNNDRTGFGLGLMIVKQAVDAHLGTIRISNSPGLGCSFIVDLPLHEPEVSSE